MSKNERVLHNNESWPGDRRTNIDATNDTNDANTDEVNEELLDPGFDEVPLETVASNVFDESVYDEVPPAEEDPAYFPPVDPVLTTDQHNDIQVLNGWAPSALSPEEQADPSAEGPQPGDEALADAVRAQLRADAITTELPIEVAVEDGIVYLRGHVTGLEDAGAAEAVASEVPGVREVADEIDVQSMDA